MTRRGSIRARGVPLSSLRLDIEPPSREPYSSRQLDRADWLADHEIEQHDVDALNELAAEVARKRAARCDDVTQNPAREDIRS